MISSGKYLDEIIQNLTVLRQEVRSKAKLGLLDINKHCEDFVKGILNIAYGLKLKNLNESSATFPGLDLGDKIAKVAFQITSTRTSDKVDHTLQQCLDKEHYKTFKEIKIFILSDKQGSYTIKTNTLPHFAFSDKENIMDFDDLYKDILLLDVDKRKKLCEYILKELPYYWKLIEGVEIGEVKTEEIIKEPEKQSKMRPLIEPTISMLRSNMTGSVLWSFYLEITSFSGVTTPVIVSSFQKNQFVRNAQVLPQVLNSIYRKSVDPKEVHFHQPLFSTGPVNHLVEQQLLFTSNCITYEFAEYHNQDMSFVNLNYPIQSLIFIILTLQKIHNEKGEKPNINISLKMDSNKPTVFFGDASPFSVGFILDNYRIHNDAYELEYELKGFDNNSIYDFIQNIYHAFICNARGNPNPYLTISKEDFNAKLESVRKEFSIGKE